jgi:hypothetical protein
MTARARNKAGAPLVGSHQHRSKSALVTSSVGPKSYASKQFGPPRPEHDAGPENSSVGLSLGVNSSATNTPVAASFQPLPKADHMASPTSTLEVAFTGMPMTP